MFLSRLFLNPRRRGTRFLLASPQRVHAAVLSSFSPDDDPGRVLWRLDTSAERTELLVVSWVEPSFEHIVEEAGWATAPGESAPYQPFLDALRPGQRWRFRLTANPVVSRRREPDSRGRPSPELSASRQLEWMLLRSERHGFTVPPTSLGVPDAAVTSRGVHRFSRRSDDQTRQVEVTWAQYDGHLEVADVAMLRTVLTTGLGKARAYGCGLLTLAPVVHRP